MADDNVVALKPLAPPPFSNEQKLALMVKYEDALCRIADAPRGRTLEEARAIACEALGIK